MRVTDKQIPMENKLIEKIDLCCERCTQPKPKLDSVLVLDGYEGYGKTTLSIAIAYYAAKKMGRSFSDKNVFFNVEKMTGFAQHTREQIIIWDEGSLGGLAAEWHRQSQINLTKLMMTCRKFRHFFIINIPKFWKLSEYLADDRTMGLIHVYARNEIQLGRFVYFNKKKKAWLYEKYRKSRSKSYKHYNFHGSFPDVLDPSKSYNILDEFDLDAYEAKKDKAIESIGEKGMNKWKLKFLKLQYLISIYPKINVKDFADYISVSKRVLYKWKEISDKYPEIQDIELGRVQR
jgi:hypothetical protein